MVTEVAVLLPRGITLNLGPGVFTVFNLNKIDLTRVTPCIDQGVAFPLQQNRTEDNAVNGNQKSSLSAALFPCGGSDRRLSICQKEFWYVGFGFKVVVHHVTSLPSRTSLIGCTGRHCLMISSSMQKRAAATVTCPLELESHCGVVRVPVLEQVESCLQKGAVVHQIRQEGLRQKGCGLQLSIAGPWGWTHWLSAKQVYRKSLHSCTCLFGQLSLGRKVPETILSQS
eukprot:1147061-Pelagomonas_calceolata.AAC.1